jgi:hypothetical protein
VRLEHARLPHSADALRRVPDFAAEDVRRWRQFLARGVVFRHLKDRSKPSGDWDHAVFSVLGVLSAHAEFAAVRVNFAPLQCEQLAEAAARFERGDDKPVQPDRSRFEQRALFPWLQPPGALGVRQADSLGVFEWIPCEVALACRPREQGAQVLPVVVVGRRRTAARPDVLQEALDVVSREADQRLVADTRPSIADDQLRRGNPGVQQLILVPRAFLASLRVPLQKDWTDVEEGEGLRHAGGSFLSMTEAPGADLAAEVVGLRTRLGLALERATDEAIEVHAVVHALPAEIEIPGVRTLRPVAPRAPAPLSESVIAVASRCHLGTTLRPTAATAA